MNCTGRFVKHLISAAIALAAITSGRLMLAQSSSNQSSPGPISGQFHRIFTVTAHEPVILDVELPQGDLQIQYRRDGEVSITGIVQAVPVAKGIADSLGAVLDVEQNGNHIKVRQAADAALPERGTRVGYRIDVPYWSEVTSVVGDGSQTISGIMGPVNAISKRGDIRASYISKSLSAHADTGNLDFQVVGEHVDAKTGGGSISGSRAVQGVDAETEEGDIALMVVGASTARVTKGSGTITVGGARASLVASTGSGSLHVKAEPHGAWQLNSTTGNIRVELPLKAQFELDATSKSGEIVVGRSDVQPPDADSRHIHQIVNGGGSSIQVSTESGRIVLQ